jgi:hypothetical protein
VVEMICDSGSVTDQCTTTKLPFALPRYQPFVPTMPSIEYETRGGVSSTTTVFAGVG